MVTQLAGDIWWYDLRGTNAYLVDDDALTLVDTGLPWHASEIIGGLRDAGFELRDLDRVLLTHYDVDHVGGLSALDGTDLTVHAGNGDAPFVTGAAKPPLSNHKGLVQRLGRPFTAAPDTPVEPVADGDTVGTFTVYETRGHTPGHVAYVSEALSVAFLGDLVLERGGTLRPSPWVLSYDTDDVERSVRSLAERAPAFDVAAMGHGVPFHSGGSDRLADVVERL